MTGYEKSPDYNNPGGRWWVLPVVAAALLMALTWHSWASDQLCPKYGECVPASKFACTSVDRSSLIYRVCYAEPEKYMIVQLGNAKTDYHYCAVPADLVARFLAADSMGRFYNSEIRSSANDGLYDCRNHTVPTF